VSFALFVGNSGSADGLEVVSTAPPCY